jgi:hypothetical protein
MCKLATGKTWPSTHVEAPKAALLDSFRNYENDVARIQACRYSKQYNVWVCATFDGVTWEARAHMPEHFVQAVVFMNGKFDSVWNCIY